jgi:hypothetical protein
MTTGANLTTAALDECEGIIERGLNTFMEVGGALLRIRDERLYRAEYRDFETYCQNRWSMSRPRAYQLMGAADIVDRLSTIVDTPLPATETQARELSGLDTETAAQVMTEAHEATNGKPTATVIRETRERILTPIPAAVPSSPEDEGPDCDYPNPLPEETNAPPELVDDPPELKPKPPNRKALPDAARDAAWELRKAVERIDRLMSDDRFTRNRDEVAAQVRSHLTFTIESCQGFLDRLPVLP